MTEGLLHTKKYPSVSAKPKRREPMGGKGVSSKKHCTRIVLSIHIINRLLHKNSFYRPAPGVPAFLIYIHIFIRFGKQLAPRKVREIARQRTAASKVYFGYLTRAVIGGNRAVYSRNIFLCFFTVGVSHKRRKFIAAPAA